MKYIIRNKPRKITVNGKTYVYAKSIDNDLMSESIVFLKLFLEGFKKTPLVFQFRASNNPSHPLYAGVKLRNRLTNSEEIMNVHEPKWVRKFIEEGIKMGWTGLNMLDYQDGNSIIENWGYDIFTKVEEWNWQQKAYKKSVYNQ